MKFRIPFPKFVPSIIFGLVFIAAGIGVILLLTSSFNASKDWIEVTATIVRIVDETVYVSYVTATGILVPSSLLDSYDSRWNVGQTLTIKYDPNNVTSCTSMGTVLSPYFSLIGIPFILAGAFIIGKGIYDRFHVAKVVEVEKDAKDISSNIDQHFNKSEAYFGVNSFIEGKGHKFTFRPFPNDTHHYAIMAFNRMEELVDMKASIGDNTELIFKIADRTKGSYSTFTYKRTSDDMGRHDSLDNITIDGLSAFTFFSNHGYSFTNERNGDFTCFRLNYGGALIAKVHNPLMKFKNMGFGSFFSLSEREENALTVETDKDNLMVASLFVLAILLRNPMGGYQ